MVPQFVQEPLRSNENAHSNKGADQDTEVDLMVDTGSRRTPNRPTYESVYRGDINFDEDDD